VHEDSAAIRAATSTRHQAHSSTVVSSYHRYLLLRPHNVSRPSTRTLTAAATHDGPASAAAAATGRSAPRLSKNGRRRCQRCPAARRRSKRWLQAAILHSMRQQQQQVCPFPILDIVTELPSLPPRPRPVSAAHPHTPSISSPLSPHLTSN
jgi:hypothetical protein